MLNDEQYIMLNKEFADHDNMPLAGGVPTAPTGYKTDGFNEILKTAPGTEKTLLLTLGGLRVKLGFFEFLNKKVFIGKILLLKRFSKGEKFPFLK